MVEVVVATRSPDKLREIRQIFDSADGIRLLDLREAGIAESAAESDLEVYPTFEENALAKARYFAKLSSRPVMADDSGICVDALDGEPGVRSKRFSGRNDLSGVDLDRSNNALLIERLRGVPAERRSAHYVCAMAVVDPLAGREEVVVGRAYGLVLEQGRGTSGFGYDPHFFAPEEERTFAELPPERKNQISHRARATLAARTVLRQWFPAT